MAYGEVPGWRSFVVAFPGACFPFSWRRCFQSSPSQLWGWVLWGELEAGKGLGCKGLAQGVFFAPQTRLVQPGVQCLQEPSAGQTDWGQKTAKRQWETSRRSVEATPTRPFAMPVDCPPIFPCHLRLNHRSPGLLPPSRSQCWEGPFKHAPILLSSGKPDWTCCPEGFWSHQRGAPPAPRVWWPAPTFPSIRFFISRRSSWSRICIGLPRKAVAILGHSPFPPGPVWQALVIDDFFCLSADKRSLPATNTYAFKALAWARDAYDRHRLEGSVEKDVVTWLLPGGSRLQELRLTLPKLLSILDLWQWPLLCRNGLGFPPFLSPVFDGFRTSLLHGLLGTGFLLSFIDAVGRAWLKSSLLSPLSVSATPPMLSSLCLVTVPRSWCPLQLSFLWSLQTSRPLSQLRSMLPMPLWTVGPQFALNYLKSLSPLYGSDLISVDTTPDLMGFFVPAFDNLEKMVVAMRTGLLSLNEAHLLSRRPCSTLTLLRFVEEQVLCLDRPQLLDLWWPLLWIFQSRCTTT